MINVAAAVIIENGKVFLASRPVDKPPAGWEFPGGKIEPGESAFEALKRELLEELNWQIEPLETLYVLKRDNLTISFISARRIPGSEPSACENQSFRWVELTTQAPADILENDIEFWHFLIKK